MWLRTLIYSKKILPFFPDHGNFNLVGYAEIKPHLAIQLPAETISF
jgi:hypothetical protein